MGLLWVEYVIAEIVLASRAGAPAHHSQRRCIYDLVPVSELAHCSPHRRGAGHFSCLEADTLLWELDSAVGDCFAQPAAISRKLAGNLDGAVRICLCGWNCGRSAGIEISWLGASRDFCHGCYTSGFGLLVALETQARPKLFKNLFLSELVS